MEAAGSMACLCPVSLDEKSARHIEGKGETYKEKCSDQNGWHASDMDGDVDLYIV